MKKNTKYIILSFFVILGIVLVIIGSSYSLFNYQVKGKTKNKITTGIYNSCEYENGTEWTFDYTGSEQTFTVPCDGEYKVELWGAQGGNIGGKGAYTVGEISLVENKNMYLYVGGVGTQNSAGVAESVKGGYNGGGSNEGQDCCNRVFGSGGGATDIRINGGEWNDFSSLKSRIMVASGGGGTFSDASTRGTGGAGGTLTGGNASGDYSDWCLGLGATQTKGGLISTVGKYCDVIENAGYTDPGMITGKFGSGGTHGSQGNNSTGGGGGYYGGSSSGHIASAGGGSSFISGYEGCDAIGETSTEDNIVHFRV